ncbi:hypothetical protein L1987_04437 [Smallanthus sonchifolius]|uniref:Uncharacterized protein n=1 Tax=Smallanthus sonchifolius TaxID=185202 RepID=A0ACB9KDF6_9ASTR|nr:hypothetical protein L1987_04437 [Smallanthus sonchifolius]
MASSSPYLKLVSCRDHNMCLNGKSPLHHSPNNHRNNFKLSISSRRGLRLSSQTEADNHELLIEESPNGYSSTQILDFIIIISRIPFLFTFNVTVEAETVGVQFQLQRECSFGHSFLITGDHPILGSWDPHNAISLTWSEGHIWTVHLDIPVGKCIKFKFIMQESNDKFVWQPGPDRILETEKSITLFEDWENPDSRIIIEMNQDIQFVEPTQEPEGYAINMKEVLVADEGVPVLVPGLSPLPVNEGPDYEPEPVNGAAMMSDMAKDLTLPESQLDSKGDIANTSNPNPRPEISSMQENQESCENKHEEMQVAEEKDHQAMSSLLHNDIQWSNNVMQKFLNLLGIQ